MKKALAILSALALVAGAAFAEGPLSFSVGTTVNAWGSDGFKWIGNTTDAYKTDDNFIGINYAAEKAGVTVDMRLDSTSKALVLHNYSAWIKPASFVKFSLGTNVAVSVLGAESIRWNCIGARTGEVQGATVELTPVDGLYVAGLVAGDIADADAFKNATFGGGASYAIAGIGTLGGQYRHDGSADANSVTGGFSLSAVENLSATVSYTAFLYNAANTASLNKIDAFITFNAGAFGLKLYDAVFLRGEKAGVAAANSLGDVFKSEFNYAFSDTVAANAKIFYMMNVADYDHWDGGFAENTDTKSNAIRVWASLPIALDKGVKVIPGFMIDQDLATANAKPTWAIPVGFYFNF